jgi:4-hydroxythreonine-4-phosphate dehydrogenase
MSEKAIIGITMGDPAGIGPEIILTLLSRRERPSHYIPLIIGSGAVLKFTAEHLGLSNPCISIPDPEGISLEGEYPYLFDLDNIDPADYSLGEISARAGRASVEYVLRAVDLALRGEIDAIVTAPIHKEAIHLAGYRYAGHTELLAERTKTDDYAMMLMGGPIRVVLATTHLPLREVADALTSEGIYRKILLADLAMKDLGFSTPRIAVAGLNPHAGEGGIFGEEERRIIAPAVERGRREGVDVSGPLPPDTVFHQAYHRKFHAVVCMYHDQGLIPLKMIAFDRGVNVTLGLPIVRTSVDHGTAFDIAGKGEADPSSLTEAVRTAVTLSRKRRTREK